MLGSGARGDVSASRRIGAEVLFTVAEKSPYTSDETSCVATVEDIIVTAGKTLQCHAIDAACKRAN